MPKNQNTGGFTIVELLIVITIIGILASVAAFVFNPLELTRRARDGRRMTDMQNVVKAISTSITFSEVPIAELLCYNLPTPCEGRSDTDTTSLDGTGWVKINLDSFTQNTLTQLPLDPTNSELFHYSYYSNGSLFEISTTFESSEYQPKMVNDNGSNSNSFELGTGQSLPL